ncbi:FecR family protein [Parafilimonas sp.]|uniref:FecR family protein n=1 Tax=Parafilimonas sp. TaxID=1969739 RepID=UPI0039E53586
MKKKLLVEELVIDDTFIHYCLYKNKDDFAYWQAFEEVNPDEAATIAEAREMVLALTTAMRIRHTEQDNIRLEKKNWFSLKRFMPYAALLAGIMLVTVFAYHGFHGKNQSLAAADANNEVVGKVSFLTANREMKNIVLTDGTKITLDAGSHITVADDFGKKSRDIYLDGEAVFDVTHNEELPFIVHTAFYNVKVLGTLFNVKAYKNEQRSETALLRGKVIVILKDHKKISLTPNNKIIFSVCDNKELRAGDEAEAADSVIAIKPISFKKTDNAIIETAWAQGRLEINNETFEQFKGRLERWYDVKITLADKEVAAYNFTATFKGESIEKVLQALQYSYHFNYKKDGKNITISK